MSAKPLSSKIKHQIKKLGGVRITGLHNDSVVLDKDKIPHGELGTHRKITLEVLRKVRDDCFEYWPALLLIITVDAEMILFETSFDTQKQNDQFWRVVKKLAPEGGRFTSAPGLEGGRFQPDAYELFMRGKKWDWMPHYERGSGLDEIDLLEENQPTIRVGAGSPEPLIEDDLLDEPDFGHDID